MMKNLKKTLCMILAFVMVLALCACGAASQPASEAPAEETPAEPANALEAIKAAGVLTVCLSPDFAPMEFVDSSKEGQEQYVGFDVTLAKYLADYIGVDLEIQAMGFDACQTAVNLGSVPMSISGFSWTEERAANYELSDYYYAGENETDQVLLIRADDADKYKTAEDFNGVDIGAQNASLQQNYVTAQLPDANCVTIGDIGVGVLELQNGNIEALAVAVGNGESIMQSNTDLIQCEWKFDVAAENEANVIMITKGETELLAVVNEALAKAYADGLYGPWYEKAKALAASENATQVTVEG